MTPSDGSPTHETKASSPHTPYRRFVAMILASALVMYVVMYFNTYQIDHVQFSWTRVYMTMMSSAAMAVIMWLFMRNMYQDRAKNTAILVGSAVVFLTGLGLVRSQALVGDVAWMRAMTPHHSIAILTSERAQLSDPRVRALADGIIETQKREIAEMNGLIRDLSSGN
ncbi:DUF305 domain-containing protein [Deinococcus ficus]|uniref:DUF305 domain-containing protein n=1 Tax=Deinococcus ficus TaxID=317577 RepID=A0A221T149_9DEIO|nr:DUF305 domain-containing protein [Deinococcus ficus]ASN82628.1 DUF305 domain-containing protein [Deinococcus ficus]